MTRKGKYASTRPLDYIYESTYIVSGAKDHARSTFMAAMANARVTIRPVYNRMFSNCDRRARCNVVTVYNQVGAPTPHQKSHENAMREKPAQAGSERFKYFTMPKKNVQLFKVQEQAQRDVTAGSGDHRHVSASKTCAVQTVYRESSAQTRPWQPPAKISEKSKTTPEVLYLDDLHWGPVTGDQYRSGDLPFDFHTTEIINKLRHARAWTLAAEGKKEQFSVMEALEAYAWLFREAEIDEIETIREELMTRILNDRALARKEQVNAKVINRWRVSEKKLNEQLRKIRLTREREHRKLNLTFSTEMSRGMRYRMSRGGGTALLKAKPDRLHALPRRDGYKGAWRDKDILYNQDKIMELDHINAAKPARWVRTCADLSKTIDGRIKPSTAFSEERLKKLHESLKATREGVMVKSHGPHLVARPAKPPPRPKTPEINTFLEERKRHTAAARLQSIVRGKAVQNVISKGLLRATDLLLEIKTTHGLLHEDKARLEKHMKTAKEVIDAAKTDDYLDKRTSSLAEGVEGASIASALIFLQNELRRLQEERRQHALAMIAAREKQLREAVEAGRRQAEESRRREHDQMFREVVGVTATSVDQYLEEFADAAREKATELEAVDRAQAKADALEKIYGTRVELTDDEQHSEVADLIHNFLLPHVHKQAARNMIRVRENQRLDTARRLIFEQIDGAVKRTGEETCIRCGRILPDDCEGFICCLKDPPAKYRDDPRWKIIGRKEQKKSSFEDRIPPGHQFSCWLNEVVENVPFTSQCRREIEAQLKLEYSRTIRERVEATLDAKETLATALENAIVPHHGPKKKPYHFLKYTRVDAKKAMAAVVLPPRDDSKPKLPSEIRREAEAMKRALEGITSEPSDGSAGTPATAD